MNALGGWLRTTYGSVLLLLYWIVDGQCFDGNFLSYTIKDDVSKKFNLKMKFSLATVCLGPEAMIS